MFYSSDLCGGDATKLLINVGRLCIGLDHCRMWDAAAPPALDTTTQVMCEKGVRS